MPASQVKSGCASSPIRPVDSETATQVLCCCCVSDGMEAATAEWASCTVRVGQVEGVKDGWEMEAGQVAESCRWMGGQSVSVEQETGCGCVSKN